ncbi:hypothetical protein PR202_ga24448 [Eleusine coracana subsp. coracana]|uniref:Serpin domain-containing protein n=1 Tax=Eleusine coracana subsp. coracana TaxID=191504 RepID=A0AAV5D7Z2_ELECO|nr:hypothetical protein PR202_ga24448 [Eleusine coracana subsp. coracana]
MCRVRVAVCVQGIGRRLTGELGQRDGAAVGGGEDGVDCRRLGLGEGGRLRERLVDGEAALRALTVEMGRRCSGGDVELNRELKWQGGGRDVTRNLLFSPLSIHIALVLMPTAAGGETLNQILPEFVRDTVIDHVLADRSGIGGPSVAFACGTWTDKRWKLNPAYVDTVVDTFKGDSSVVDFRNKPVESRKQINAWVARATKNLITQILNPNSGKRDTVHVVVNAIYFKGDWRTPFKQTTGISRNAECQRHLAKSCFPSAS